MPDLRGIEDGYSEHPGDVADHAAELGVAGIHMEDNSSGASVEPALHAAKVVPRQGRRPGQRGRQLLQETME